MAISDYIKDISTKTLSTLGGAALGGLGGYVVAPEDAEIVSTAFGAALGGLGGAAISPSIEKSLKPKKKEKKIEYGDYTGPTIIDTLNRFFPKGDSEVKPKSKDKSVLLSIKDIPSNFWKSIKKRGWDKF